VVEHRVAGAPLDFSGLRVELDVPGDFSSQAVACAQAAAQAVRLPDFDRTDLELVTVDPPGSMDLDQALHIAPCEDGYRVSYAIADVASFVPPASVLDEELQVRGETIYFPDARVPLHPTVLSEGAASLLPDQVRPAVLWEFELDGFGEVTKVDVRRARVRSRARLDYAGVQASLRRDTRMPLSGCCPRSARCVSRSLDSDMPSTSIFRRRRSSAPVRPGPCATERRYRWSPTTPKSR
jgi:exoribonuclease R